MQWTCEDSWEIPAKTQRYVLDIWSFPFQISIGMHFFKNESFNEKVVVYQNISYDFIANYDYL